MIKFLFYLCKRIIIVFLFIYTYNIIVFPLNVMIPINLFTVAITTVFGFPATFCMSLFMMFVF